MSSATNTTTTETTKKTTTTSTGTAYEAVDSQIDFSKHVEYIVGLEQKTKTSDALYFTDHKRLSGVYWALSSLSLLNKLDILPEERIIKYVLSCYNETEYGFSGNTDQDVHILYTLSGIQILSMYDKLEVVNVDKIAESIGKLQNDDGSFCGDRWGEIDTRFSYCAILILKIINQLHVINISKTIQFILTCQNFDGGFGCIPNSESHAGQIFCCVATLNLLDFQLPLQKKEQLGFWLCQRQLPCGGFNGRPDKLQDVCYSWWVLASLNILNMIDFIDSNKLAAFIIQCQDLEDGGFADRPGDMADVFHTFFGLAALSMLDHYHLKHSKFQQIDPSFALSTSIVQRL